jgi:peptidoglycan/xylan/chitin deacetylase (PgdA/CDA1 family)
VMKKSVYLNNQIRVVVEYIFLIILVGIFSLVILKFFNLNTRIISQIYVSPYPEIKYSDQYFNQSSIIPYPSPRSGDVGYKVPILMYHYISVSPWKEDKTRIGLSTPPYFFEKQLETLAKNGFSTITFDDLLEVMAGKATLPLKPIILTFDDGYVDFYQNAYPLLQKYQMKGIVFVITGLVGRTGYLTWPQITELGQSPYVMIGSHTINHAVLPVQTPTVLEQELHISKAVLESHINKPVNWFAYPYGNYNKKVVDAVRNAGYLGATITLPGTTQYESLRFYLPRIRASMHIENDLLKLIE